MPLRQGKKDNESYQWPVDDSLGEGLDNSLKYPLVVQVLTQYPPGEFTSGEIPVDDTVNYKGILSDAPSQGFSTEHDGQEILFEEVYVNDGFLTWLMFRPDGVDSKWVPLHRLAWSWMADAYFDSSNATSGVISSSGPAPGGAFESVVHPLWDKIHLNNQTLVPVGSSN